MTCSLIAVLCVIAAALGVAGVLGVLIKSPLGHRAGELRPVGGRHR